MNRFQGIRRYVWVLMTFTAGLWLLAGTAFAQTDSGNVTGTVRDRDRAPIPGVTVTISGVGAPQTFVTAIDGQFRFLRLPPGRYTISAELPGFATIRRSVDVTVANTLDVPLQLAQTAAEEITVTAATPMIDRRATGTGENLSLIELQEVPTARDPWVMLQSVPGVLVDRVNIGGNKSGQQSYFVGKGVERHQTAWNLDGVNVADMQATGTSGFYYDFDSFEELQVSTGSADPAVQTPGVQIRMVTKRGTNDFRGSGRWFWTDEQFQSTPTLPAEFADYDEELDYTTVNSIQHIDDYGAEAGGPIVRDRLFFWAAYSRNFIDNVSGFFGTSQKTTLDSWNGKLNAQIASNNSATGYYMYNNAIKKNRGSGLPEALRNQTGPGHVIKIEDTHNFSPNLYMTVLASDIRNGYQLVPVSGMDVNVYWDQDGSRLRRSNKIYQQHVPQNQYRGDGAAFFKTGGLSHELKYGFGYRTTPVRSYSAWPGEQTWGEFYDDPSDNRAALTRPSSISYGSNYRDLYVGDTMLLGNFTLTGGIRYDLQRAKNNPSEVPANPAFSDILPAVQYAGDTQALEWKSWSPKIGATYAFGNGRNIVRASYSRYVDQLGSSDVGPNNPFYLVQILYYDWQDRNGDRNVQRDEILNLARGPVSWRNIDPANPSSGFSVGRVDYDMDPTKTDEFTVGYQREIGQAFSVAANYTYRKRFDFLWDRYEKTRGGNDFYTRADFVPVATPITGTLPNGESYSESYYRLRPGLAAPVYYVTTNRDDYHQTYHGVELIGTKRLTDNWMMRANVTLSDWKQHVGDDAVFDPSRILDEDSCASCNGAAVASNGGTNGYINSRWSASLNTVYQLPMRFSVGAAIVGREGYIIPYYRRQNSRDGLGNRRILVADFDANRLDDLWNVDLRVGKEFTLPAGVDLSVSLDLFNATDERTVLWRDNRLYNANGANLESGNNNIQEIQSPRVWRLGARFSF